MRFTEIESRLRKFRAGIAGAGGLGSNCAVALARSGIGTLVIADFDKIEPANLNRQYYFADQAGMYKTDAMHTGQKMKSRSRPVMLYLAMGYFLNCCMDCIKPEI